MDRKYIDDHHIVARYLANQLSDAERMQFEAHYLDHPEVVQEIEAAARFKAGLMHLRDTGELDRISQQPPPWYRQARNIAVAATLAILVVGTFYVVQRHPAAQPLLVTRQDALRDWIGGVLPVGSTHTIERTRSTSYDARIKVADAAAAIQLRVLPEFSAQRYRIALLRRDAGQAKQSVAQIDDLNPDADGLVTVYVNGARLRAGDYQLLISADAPDGSAALRSAFLIAVQYETAAPVN